MDEQLKVLETFANSKDEVVASTAKQLIDLVSQAKDQKITLSELQELTGDILDLETVDKLTESIEDRVIIKEAFTAMTKVISIAASFITVS